MKAPSPSLPPESRVRAARRIPELIAEVYSAGPAPLRAGLLECLLQPVGPLALVALAGGTFGRFLHRGRATRPMVLLEDASRISSAQMLELARYVAQRNPDTFRQIASLLAEHPAAIAGASASALLSALQP